MTDNQMARSPLPITISPPPTRLRLVRSIAGLVVFGPPLGVLIVLGFAVWQGGVSAWAVGALIVTYCLSTLGVTIGFHRYFAHRSFRTSPLMEWVFVVLGSMAAQGPLLYWVSTHRRHHQFSDTPDDPHSPHFPRSGRGGGWRGFVHGHVGWMFSPTMTNAVRFAPDVIRNRHAFGLQQRYGLWILATLLAPPAIAFAVERDGLLALEVFLWSGPLRLFLVHHASWAVGSLSHMYGAQPFSTSDHSRNNWWVALFAFGEGLQNNHHAFPRAARHAFAWWEPDLSGHVIQLLAAFGLVKDLHKPSATAIAARRRTANLEDTTP